MWEVSETKILFESRFFQTLLSLIFLADLNKLCTKISMWESTCQHLAALNFQSLLSNIINISKSFPNILTDMYQRTDRNGHFLLKSSIFVLLLIVGLFKCSMIIISDDLTSENDDKHLHSHPAMPNTGLLDWQSWTNGQNC